MNDKDEIQRLGNIIAYVKQRRATYSHHPIDKALDKDILDGKRPPPQPQGSLPALKCPRHGVGSFYLALRAPDGEYWCPKCGQKFRKGKAKA